MGRIAASPPRDEHAPRLADPNPDEGSTASSHTSAPRGERAGAPPESPDEGSTASRHTCAPRGERAGAPAESPDEGGTASRHTCAPCGERAGAPPESPDEGSTASRHTCAPRGERAGAPAESPDEGSTASRYTSAPRGERAGAPAEESDAAWIDQRLRRLTRVRGALDAEEAWLLRQAEGAKLWRAFGYASMLEYLERAVGYAPHTARERLRVAKALEDLPRITEALERGQITQSAARELTRVASCGTEEAWLAAVEGKCLREIEAAVSGKQPGSMPEDPSEPSLRKRRVVLELTPEALDLLRQGAARLSELHGHRLSQEETILAALRMALEPRDEGGVNRPAYQIAIKTCPDCKRSWQHGGGREREIGPEVVEQARCDAEHLGSLDAAAPERKTSTVTPRVREQVFARDGYTCQVPGCRRNHGLDIHHIVFQERGGGHELSNLMLMCSHHHAALHHGTLVVQGQAPDALVVAFPRGHAPEGFEDLNDEPIDWLMVAAQAAPRAAPAAPAAVGPHASMSGWQHTARAGTCTSARTHESHAARDGVPREPNQGSDHQRRSPREAAP